MTKLIEVAVTEEDIKEGDKTSKNCPTARAIKRSLIEEKIPIDDISVAIHYPSHAALFTLKSNGKEYSNFLPLEVSLFVERVTKGEKVEPINFFIKDPETVF